MNLSDAALEPIIAKAIIDSITPETRAELIGGAVKALLAKPSGAGSSYNQPSIIQQAFNSAVRNCAEKMAQEQLTEDPEFKAKLKALFADVSEKLFADETRTELVGSIAARILTALTKDRY